MDLSDYWQENKRFVTGVALGALVFLIASLGVRSHFEDDIRARRREIAQRQSDLAVAMFDANDLADARLENEALTRVVSRLSESSAFRPREGFGLKDGGGAANAQYLRVLSNVRDELTRRANRANLELDPTLGMPALSPTRGEEIVRYLEALDLVDNLTDLALRAGVKRVEKIRIQLDPGLRSRDGLGPVERTRVSFSLTGTSESLTRVLAWTRRPPAGRTLHIDGIELLPSRSKSEEVRMELTLLIVRLAELEETS